MWTYQERDEVKPDQGWPRLSKPVLPHTLTCTVLDSVRKASLWLLYDPLWAWPPRNPNAASRSCQLRLQVRNAHVGVDEKKARQHKACML